MALNKLGGSAWMSFLVTKTIGMNNLNYNQKLSILHSLLTMINVDNIESETELDFIYQLGVKLGIKREDVDGLIDKTLEFFPPKAEYQRIVLFYTFLLVMKLDGVLSTNERKVCEDIGFKLGLNPFAVQNLIDTMLSNPEKKVPAIDIVNFFKLYHN